MRWVEAIYGDQPHGIGGADPGVRPRGHHQRAARLRQGPAADKYKARDNLAEIDERAGSPINPGNLQ